MSALRGDLKKYRAAIRSKEVAQKKALINHVFQRPAIWNRNVESHKSRCYVDTMWDEVAAQTGWDREFCKKTWKHLVDHFRNLYCHTMFRKDVPGGKETLPTVKWTYFKSMMFMKDCVQTRLAFPNADADDGEVFIDAENSAEPNCSWPDAENVTQFVVEDVRNISDDITAQAVVEINDVMRCAQTGTPSGTPSTSPAKRRKMDLDTVTNYQSKSSPVNVQKTEDTEDKFCQFLGDILREVSPKLRRSCRSMLLEVCNSFADGKIPTLIQPESNEI